MGTDKMKKLVLFDIDGTILSMKRNLSKQLFANAIKEVYDKEVEIEKMPNFAGNTDLAIIKSICEAVDLDLQYFHSKIDTFWKVKLRIFSDYATRDYFDLHHNSDNLILKLNNSDNIQLGLLTGNFEANAYQKINVYGLGKYFSTGAFGNDHENRNLLPEIAVQRANQNAGVSLYSAENTMIIGDSPKDIECARYYGAKVLAVSNKGYSIDELESHKPDFLFNDFSKLEEVIEKITEE